MTGVNSLTYKCAARHEEHRHRTTPHWVKIRRVERCDERGTFLQGDRTTLAEVRYRDLLTS